MLGKRSPQLGMFEADHVYLDFVGRESFYGFVAKERGILFRDEDFVCLYCPHNGRNSVPPSFLVTALLVQAHVWVSDDEAPGRLRHVLDGGVGGRDRPAPLRRTIPVFLGKSTLQLFRAQLILQETGCVRSFNAAGSMGTTAGTFNGGR